MLTNTYNFRTTHRFPEQNNPALTGSCTLFVGNRIKLGWQKLILIACTKPNSSTLTRLFKHINLPHLPIIIFGSTYSTNLCFNRFQMKNGKSTSGSWLENDQLLMGSQIYYHDHRSGLRIDRQMGLVQLDNQIHHNPDIVESTLDLHPEKMSTPKDIITIILDKTVHTLPRLSEITRQSDEIWLQAPDKGLSDLPRLSNQETVSKMKTGSVAVIGDRINKLSQIYMYAEG